MSEPLVKVVPDKDCEPIKALLAKKHFEKWEKENRNRISDALDKLI